MKDYSRFPAPREVPVGEPITHERRRRPPNPNLTYIALGCALLCICAALGVGAFTLPLPGVGAPLISFDSGSAPAAPTASARASTTATPRGSTSGGAATPIPFARSVTAKNGLKVSVTYYQRPLPIQGVTVPEGQELAVVSLRLENTGTGTLSLKPADFYLVTADNEQYNPDKGGLTTGTMLRAMDLKAGDTFEGDLVYFVRKDVGELLLGWKSSDGVKLLALQRGK